MAHGALTAALETYVVPKVNKPPNVMNVARRFSVPAFRGSGFLVPTLLHSVQVPIALRTGSSAVFVLHPGPVDICADHHLDSNA
jgi:hypothetical protein